MPAGCLELILIVTTMPFLIYILQVLINKDEASEELQNGILLRPVGEKEATRIRPNPNLKVQPVFVDPGPRKTSKAKNNKKGPSNGLCLEITGRVQHDTNELSRLIVEGKLHGSSNSNSWHEPSVSRTVRTSDDSECTLDYYWEVYSWWVENFHPHTSEHAIFRYNYSRCQLSFVFSIFSGVEDGGQKVL